MIDLTLPKGAGISTPLPPITFRSQGKKGPFSFHSLPTKPLDHYH